ncbi:MAG: c-type cytochrome biogenesis protein CcsB [Mycobacteriales bacterium]
MPVDAGLATLSDHLFVWGILLYSVALISYCGEYAFGRRGKVAVTAEEPAPVRAGGPTPSPDAPVPPAGRSTRAERFGRIAVAATAVGLGLQLASLTTRGLATDRVPWGNMYEFSSVVGAAGVTAFLAVLVRLPQVRYLGMFLLMPVVVLLFLAGTVLYSDAAPLVPALRSYWIVIHVTSIAIGTGIFLVSFVGTVLYLVRRKWDLAMAAGRTPKRFPLTLGRRLPPAEVLDKMAYRSVAFGFPIYTFGIISGAIWAEAAWGRYWGWDPKETWAFITWVVYAAYLHARATAGWRGTAAARVNLVAFATMIFNFFVVNMVISGLHSYAGLT